MYCKRKYHTLHEHSARVFVKGEGSALLERAPKLERMARAVARVCGRFGVPLTAKLRTGVSDKRLLAHSLLPRLRDAGIALATVRLSLLSCARVFMYLILCRFVSVTFALL